MGRENKWKERARESGKIPASEIAGVGLGFGIGGKWRPCPVGKLH